MFTSFRCEIMHQLWAWNSSSVWYVFVNLFFLNGVACGLSRQVGCSTLYGSSFFFQAEDGIRDLTVTGVQTCALPISRGRIPRRFADVLIEPARAGAPQLEAVVQPERESRAHEADELAVGEEPRGLDPGDAALDDDRQRGCLRGGPRDRHRAEQGQECEARPHLRSGGRVAA